MAPKLVFMSQENRQLGGIPHSRLRAARRAICPTAPASQDGLGTFSPDGKMVAFVSNRGGGWAVWVVKVDGTGLTKLFNLPGAADRALVRREHVLGTLEARAGRLNAAETNPGLAQGRVPAVREEKRERMTITILGLGPGDPAHLTREAWDLVTPGGRDLCAHQPPPDSGGAACPPDRPQL